MALKNSDALALCAFNAKSDVFTFSQFFGTASTSDVFCLIVFLLLSRGFHASTLDVSRAKLTTLVRVLWA
jgi:hypothetical protein